MRKIVLSADSTCDLSPELKERYNVHYYPFHIIYRGESYQDNVDITPQTLYDGYYEDGSLPQTAAINVAEYVDYFTPFVEEGYEVIHLNLGSAISSAHENCLKAAEQFEGVYAIDSQSLSTGIALQVIKAGRLIEQGLSAPEIVEQVKNMRACTHASFVLDTLDFMAAGGRCPQVLALIGRALKFKPEILVHNNDGSMSVGKIYRGKLERCVRKYVRDTISRYPDIICDDIFITHSGCDDAVIEAAREELCSLLDVEHVHVTRASCTIASHCGPGTLGVLFVTETPAA